MWTHLYKNGTCRNRGDGGGEDGMGWEGRGRERTVPSRVVYIYNLEFKHKILHKNIYLINFIKSYLV